MRRRGPCWNRPEPRARPRPGSVLTVPSPCPKPCSPPRGSSLPATQCPNEPLAYLHNLTENPGHFVTLRLEGTRSNRDGVGARVTVVAGRHRQVAHRLGGGSYQSANESRLHFGIGDRSRVDSVEVRWPSGRVDQWTDLAADTGYLLREGAGQTSPLPGFQIRPTPGK